MILFKFVLSRSDLKPDARPRETATGTVFMILDGSAVPRDGWSDFPVAVLGAAIEAYRQLAAGAAEAYSNFFDGSYYVWYTRAGTNEDIRIEAWTDVEEPPELLASATVPLADIWKTLRDAVDGVIAELTARQLMHHSDMKAARKMSRILDGSRM
jgi:hypothetical protein